LTEAAETLRKDLSTGVVVLTGTSEFFSAGLDLRDPEFARLLGLPLPARRQAIMELGPRMCRVWEELPQITIAAWEGFCIGGAVSLALACDFRIMSENAFFRIPEIDLAMNYSWGSLPRLTALAGPARAKQWVILADQVDAFEARTAGFTQWTAPPGEAERKALEIAGKIAAKPQGPVTMTKETVNALFAASRSAGHMDADQFALTALSEDFQEGIEAFLNRRSPVFNKAISGGDD
jgi:enoyl-CoA hydratase/carnithine racemase